MTKASRSCDTYGERGIFKVTTLDAETVLVSSGPKARKLSGPFAERSSPEAEDSSKTSGHAGSFSNFDGLRAMPRNTVVLSCTIDADRRYD